MGAMRLFQVSVKPAWRELSTWFLSTQAGNANHTAATTLKPVTLLGAMYMYRDRLLHQCSQLGPQRLPANSQLRSVTQYKFTRMPVPGVLGSGTEGKHALAAGS